ncbi:MAG: hypothetical protein IIB18_07615 [Chloroflexi bacterium]|nr:hypothetical protein [Chloroflexota bacterium]
MLDRENKAEGRKDDRERGQTLVLFALMLTVMLGFVALTVDVGLAFLERRQMQNAVDAAALAAAQDLTVGQSNEIAEATAYDYMDRNGYPEADGIDVNIPPLSGPYTGLSGYVEVLSTKKAPTAFLTLFLDEGLDVGARAVAKGTAGQAGDAGPGGNGGGNAAPPAVVPSDAVCGSPVVDGRVMAGEGYTKLGDLTGGSTDFGDFFYGCDSTYIYFAMMLNANSPTGVANENVYGDDSYIKGYNTGWEKTHTFGKLLGSDRARFQIACDGVAVHDFIQDYLRGDSGQNGWASDALGNGKILGGGPVQSASSLEFNLENPEITGWGDDAGEDPQESSPPYFPTYGFWDSEYDGFVWEMIYEFKLLASDYAGCQQIQFGLHNFAGESGQLEGLHSSPAKTDEGITLLIDKISELRLVE